ncbi:hypothetical protein MKEN_00347900 [Mycena kentingensis (nom. inval.)]|nr:hypothetical protein MKEN_00347900 [Mycena kentingensis (nom. inval.)]
MPPPIVAGNWTRLFGSGQRTPPKAPSDVTRSQDGGDASNGSQDTQVQDGHETEHQDDDEWAGSLFSSQPRAYRREEPDDAQDERLGMSEEQEKDKDEDVSPPSSSQPSPYQAALDERLANDDMPSSSPPIPTSSQPEYRPMLLYGDGDEEQEEDEEEERASANPVQPRSSQTTLVGSGSGYDMTTSEFHRHVDDEMALADANADASEDTQVNSSEDTYFASSNAESDDWE